MATTLRCRSLAAREISNLNISPPPIPTFLMRANLSRALIRKKPARSRAELSMWLRLVLASRKVERWRKRSGEWCGLRRYSEHPYLCGVSGDATDGKKAGLTLCPTHDCRPPHRLSCSSPDVDSPVCTFPLEPGCPPIRSGTRSDQIKLRSMPRHLPGPQLCAA